MLQLSQCSGSDVSLSLISPGCLQGVAVLRVLQRDPAAVPAADPMQAILPGGADQVPLRVTGQ